MTSRWRALALLSALMLVVAACGNDDAAEGEGRTVIRFSFAPDPVWDYMNDNGMIVEWEEENNTRVVTSSTWDEFTFFAGGHGDIVSMATMELPVLEAETSLKTVSFGKYNAQRSPMFRRADSDYNTLADIPAGSPICVASPVSNSGYWGIAMMELHGIDYRVGGGDYELIVNDHFVNPANLLNGDCEAAVIIPEAAASYMRNGELEMMYDGILPFQQYNQFSGADSQDMHVMSNLFTATETFFEAEPEAVKAFLALWEDGIDAWQVNKADIIATYPQHFSVESDEDVAFIQEFMEGRDWFVDTVYLTEEWIESEKRIWEFQSNLNPDNPNYVTPGFDEPRFEVVEP